MAVIVQGIKLGPKCLGQRIQGQLLLCQPINSVSQDVRMKMNERGTIPTQENGSIQALLCKDSIRRSISQIDFIIAF